MVHPLPEIFRVNGIELRPISAADIITMMEQLNSQAGEILFNHLQEKIKELTDKLKDKIERCDRLGIDLTQEIRKIKETLMELIMEHRRY